MISKYNLVANKDYRNKNFVPKPTKINLDAKFKICLDTLIFFQISHYKAKKYTSSE